jgi:hypothetical protein
MAKDSLIALLTEATSVVGLGIESKGAVADAVRVGKLQPVHLSYVHEDEQRVTYRYESQVGIDWGRSGKLLIQIVVYKSEENPRHEVKVRLSWCATSGQSGAASIRMAKAYQAAAATACIVEDILHPVQDMYSPAVAEELRRLDNQVEIDRRKILDEDKAS